MFDFASRIAKLDAVNLDKEFLSFLKREITGLLTAITKEEYLLKFKPEISLLLKFLVWKFTTASGSTIGQKLLGIRYAPIPGKLKMLFVLEGFIPYIVERFQSIHNHDSVYLEQIRDPIRQIEKLFKILHILNFCTFLIQNRYPTIASRLLGLPMESKTRRMGPSEGYTYQIRELLWHQFADFLITMLPMINLQKIRRSVGNWLGGGGSSSSANANLSLPPGGNNVEENTSSGGDVRVCSICNEDAVIPQKYGGEYFCYYCYQAVVDDKF